MMSIGICDRNCMRDAPARQAAEQQRRRDHAERIAAAEQGHGDAVEAVADAEAGRVIEVQPDHVEAAAPDQPAHPRAP